MTFVRTQVVSTGKSSGGTISGGYGSGGGSGSGSGTGGGGAFKPGVSW